MNGTEGPKCELRGLNEAADGGYATVHPLVDFNSCTNGRVRIRPISLGQHTQAAINAGLPWQSPITVTVNGHHYTFEEEFSEEPGTVSIVTSLTGDSEGRSWVVLGLRLIEGGEAPGKL